jgi:transcriptional regulator with XRE-family HTH domain
MAEGESPAAARRRLRLALRKAREVKRLTQRQVAESLDWSLSKVNRIEAGDVTITSTDLQALLRLLDVNDPDRVEDLTEAGRAARRRGWWDRADYREHLSAAMIQAIQFETEATAIRSFQPTLIPGVLQIKEYATAVLDAWRGKFPDADLATRLQVRMLRREQLFSRSEPPAYLLVLDESVLLREVGGPQVMAAQLYDLLRTARSGPVVVRILPLAYRAIHLIGLFMIYASDDEDVALYRESNIFDEVVYAPDTIRQHRQLFEEVWEQSLDVDTSLHLIEATAATLRSTVDRHMPSG